MKVTTLMYLIFGYIMGLVPAEWSHQTKQISLLQEKKHKKRGLVKHPLHLYKLVLIFSLKKI